MSPSSGRWLLSYSVFDDPQGVVATFHEFSIDSSHN